MAKHPAIFLDRDGTIIEDRGHIHKSSNIAYYPYAFKALKKLQQNFLLFIITNQSGVSKGIISERDVQNVNENIVHTMKEHGVTIFDVFYCPHKNEDHCACKKPSPYFIHRAAELYNLDLNRSYMIGDHPTDIECGINAGVIPIYLLSGHGNSHLNELKPDVTICNDLSDASRIIIEHKKYNT